MTQIGNVRLYDDRSHDSEPVHCLNNMKDTANELNDGGLSSIEKCSHIYHTSCIKAWSDVTNSCPSANLDLLYCLCFKLIVVVYLI